MKTIKVTTKQMFDMFMDCAKDVMWDNREPMNDLKTHIQSLLTDDIDGIRKLFKDGYTPFLVKMDLVDRGDGEETEIRVYNRDNKLIGVVIDSEIVY